MKPDSAMVVLDDECYNLLDLNINEITTPWT
jgi:hypothetical protein